MIRLFGSICGLIVFSATILVGLATGAEPGALIPRAAGGMIGGVGLGLVAGWIGMWIVRDGAAQDANDEAEAVEVADANADGGGDVTIVGG